MQKLLSLFVALAVVFFLSTAHGSENTMVRICYVPFGVETYVPMTVANIDSHCSHVGELDMHDKKYLDIQSLIRKAGVGSFKDEFVRVKIAVPGSDHIYIDNYGGVKIGGYQCHLDASTLSKVGKILDKVTSMNDRK